MDNPYEDERFKHMNGMQNGYGSTGGGAVAAAGAGASYVNEVVNPVEDHYNRSGLSQQQPQQPKSVGWAEDNMIQPAHNGNNCQSMTPCPILLKIAFQFYLFHFKS